MRYNLKLSSSLLPPPVEQQHQRLLLLLLLIMMMSQARIIEAAGQQRKTINLSDNATAVRRVNMLSTDIRATSDDVLHSAVSLTRPLSHSLNRDRPTALFLTGSVTARHRTVRRHASPLPRQIRRHTASSGAVRHAVPCRDGSGVKEPNTRSSTDSPAYLQTTGTLLPTAKVKQSVASVHPSVCFRSIFRTD